MSGQPDCLWRWPGWRHLGFAVLLACCQTLWFALIFGGADYLTGLHDYRVRLHLDWELDIPFVPATVLGYLSIYPLFVLAPFLLRSRQELRRLTFSLATVTLCGGICFLIFPADLLFPSTPLDLGFWTEPVHFAKRVALRHNLMPSLHVAMSAVCVFLYTARTGTVGKVLFTVWSIAISVSTVLLHQHYVVDVIAGYGLAYWGVRAGPMASLPSCGERGNLTSRF